MRKHRLLGNVKHLFVPLLPVVGLMVLLVMAQPDMGTMLTVVAVAVALFFVIAGGTPFTAFLVAFGVISLH